MSDNSAWQSQRGNSRGGRGGAGARGRGGYQGGPQQQQSRPQQHQQQQQQQQQFRPQQQQQGWQQQQRGRPQQQGGPHQQGNRPQQSFRPPQQSFGPPAVFQKLPPPKVGKGLPSMFPKRPDRPSGAPVPGRSVQLYVNLFNMRLNQDKTIYQTSVDVDMVAPKADGDQPKDADAQPRKLNGNIRRSAVEAAIKSWVKKVKPTDYDAKLSYNYVFDTNGSVMYSLFDVFRGSSEKTLTHAVKINLDTIVDQKVQKLAKEFIVKFHRGAKLDLRDLFDKSKSKQSVDIRTIQEQLRAISVILRGEINTLYDTHVLTRYNIFPYLRENQVSIGPGVILNRGYSLSPRLMEGGLNLNIANKNAAFHEEVDLLDMLRNVYRVSNFDRPLDKSIIEKMKKEIKNKQVESRCKNFGTPSRPHYRKYRVNDIAGSSEEKLMLRDKKTNNTREATIADYYKIEYNLTIKYPKLPCIVDKGRKIPLEICHLIDKQRVLRKMTPEETSTIIRLAALPPQQYFQQLEKNLQETIKHKQPLNDFGLDFKPEKVEVTGRQLAPMLLKGGSNTTINPSNGQYDARNCKFIRPVTVKSWIVAVVIGRENERELANDNSRRQAEDNIRGTFCDMYRQGGVAKGVTIGPVAGVFFIDGRGNDRTGPMRDLKKSYDLWSSKSVDHAIIVLPKDFELNWVYGYLKYLEVAALGKSLTRTSCVKYSNFRKIDRERGNQFIGNLWLKHNSKLGGANFVLAGDGNFLKAGILIVSVDVCHPAPGDDLFQSIAAVVGSWDIDNAQTSNRVALKVQMKLKEKQSTREDVTEIDTMFEEVLDAYKEKKGKLPERIIILRDGVSEGQFRMVLEEELTKVAKMLVKKYNDKRPPITCIVVQKRHDTKFMLKEPVKDFRGNLDYNIQPGTVVDSDIIHPHDHSFYSSPHKAIQGTARPPHFYVICDENQFSRDEMQSMMQALSYLSPRCNKSTSIPTPVNLADLAAERGKNIVVNFCEANTTKKMKDTEKIAKVNEFLTKMANQAYKGTLYHV